MVGDRRRATSAGWSAPARRIRALRRQVRRAARRLGPATEPKTGRKFFLDYPCDLKPGEKVSFVLNIHGAGAIGNWQRHYFPAVDFKEKYRLVVATPTAATRRRRACWNDGRRRPPAEHHRVGVRRASARRNIKRLLAGRPQPGRDHLQPDRLQRLFQGQGGRLAQPVRRPHRPGAVRGRRSARPAPTARRAATADPRAGCAAEAPARGRRLVTSRTSSRSGDQEIVGLPTTSPFGRASTAGRPRVRRQGHRRRQAGLRLGLRPRPSTTGLGHEGPAGDGAGLRLSRAARAAAWSPTWCAWTRATPRAWSPRSPRRWSDDGRRAGRQGAEGVSRASRHGRPATA